MKKFVEMMKRFAAYMNSTLNEVSKVDSMWPYPGTGAAYICAF